MHAPLRRPRPTRPAAMIGNVADRSATLRIDRQRCRCALRPCGLFPRARWCRSIGATAPRKTKAGDKPQKSGMAARPKEVEIKVDRALAQGWKKLLAVLESSNVEGMRAWD